MKKILLIAVAFIAATSVYCLIQSDSNMNDNPFYSEYDTPFGVPPFDKIKNEHYLPAFKDGFKQEMEEINAIASNEEEPTFENTIAALDRTGKLLSKVSSVFYNLLSADTNEELQNIAKEISPLSSKHNDDIYLNEDLFKRIKVVYDKKDDLEITKEQEILLDKYYKEFVRGGALLSDEDKETLRNINKELSLALLTFGDNVLAEDNDFKLVIEDEAELSGLPESARKGAAETAASMDMEGKWVFTLHKPSLIPFLQYSDIREYREKMLKGYINRSNNDNEYDNKELINKIVNLRIQKAELLGYDTHADFVLEKNMAQEPAKVYELLNKLWDAALPIAKQEAEELQAMIEKDGKDFELEAWDWWYYAEKLRKEKYDLDDSELRPYFKLDNVREGAFMVANKLWGLEFEERTDLPVYHPDVKAFEVKEADGSHIGILYMDFFPRASKRGGAWMNAYRSQHRNGEDVSPIIVNVLNFSKPVGDKPSLISFDEALTLFHEFGHALHGLLSDCTYKKLSGTSVPRDFVELPSQVMENWAGDPEVIKMYAKHYETGEPIPDKLVEKIKNSSHFNQGFVTIEYLAASFLDMDWHTLSEPYEGNPMDFEKKSMDKIGLIDEIVVRYKSPYFRHIFAGGYASGYYSYIWAEVLDADAYQAFKEQGDVFHQETAQKFRNNVLSRGGTDDAMTLYVKFRGQEPDIQALLDKRGLN